jgi:hypothetical protein
MGVERMKRKKKEKVGESGVRKDLNENGGIRRKRKE